MPWGGGTLLSAVCSVLMFDVVAARDAPEVAMTDEVGPPLVCTLPAGANRAAAANAACSAGVKDEMSVVVTAPPVAVAPLTRAPTGAGAAGAAGAVEGI